MTLEELQSRVLAALGPNPEAALRKQLFTHVRREVWDETIADAKKDILHSFSDRLKFLRDELGQEEAMLAKRQASVQEQLGNPTFADDELKRLYNEAAKNVRLRMEQQLWENGSYIDELRKKVRRVIRKKLMEGFAADVAKLIVEREVSAFSDKSGVLYKIRNRVLHAEAEELRDRARSDVLARFREEIRADKDAVKELRAEARQAVKTEIAAELKKTGAIRITTAVEQEIIGAAVSTLRQRLDAVLDARGLATRVEGCAGVRNPIPAV